VTFPSGLKAEHQGNDARCMTCHQGVESTDSVNRAVSGLGDDQVDPKLDFVNVHYKAAGATLFGTMAKVGYEYPGKTYAGRLQHPQP
jgi:cytochrome c peroxidase